MVVVVEEEVEVVSLSRLRRALLLVSGCLKGGRERNHSRRAVRYIMPIMTMLVRGMTTLLTFPFSGFLFLI